MNENQASITALVTAFARAYHATRDTDPIFNDFLAYQFFTEKERTDLERNIAEFLKFADPERAASCPDQATALAWVMRVQTAPITISRSRYTEDNLEEAIRHGVQQYVILGAGMDTFAFRQQKMRGELEIEVFEVDHPATQAFKRQRLAELGWEQPAKLHFVPADFTKESLAEALTRSPYDPKKLTFFSWLGVTYYLTRDEVFNALRSMATLAPSGSAIVFDYRGADALDPDKMTKREQKEKVVTQRIGEPMKSAFNPSALAADLAPLGLRLHENLDPADIEEHYFQGRTDGYHAFAHIHFAQAVVV